MENFQLYRTNVLLGGQVKWDIVLENDNKNVYIEDFNLSPISYNIPYTYKYNENILNNNHRSNIKSLYKSIEGNFYSEGLDDKFITNWPDIIKPNEHPNVYSNIYDMGCKRTKNYNRYNKQFEFFCPLWLEHVNDSIIFKITVKGNNSNSILAIHTIDILAKDGHKKHDKFTNYLKEHLIYTGIDKGNDKVIKVKFNDESYVSGLNVKNGIKSTLNISNIVTNMIIRERPVIETDNMLMNCFVNNNMICDQLFNFNLCFNIDDVMSSTTAKLLKGKLLNISVDVIVDGIELSKKDFYCNYDYIEKEKCYDVTLTMPSVKLDEFKNKYPNIFNGFNVFSHLHDNEYLDLINTNKYCPKICHWSLSENPSYLFNLYRGFDGYSIISDNVDNEEQLILVENEHQYGSTPNTTISEYSLSHNNIGWINYDELDKWGEFYDYIVDTDFMKVKKAIWLHGQQYINGLKYGYVPYKNDDSSDITENKYLIGIKTSPNLFNSISNTFINEISWLDNNLGLYIKNNLIMFITYNWKYLTFATVFDLLFEQNKNGFANLLPIHIPYIDNIYKMLQSVINPEIIPLNGTVLWGYVQGPNKNVTEVEYYKNNNIDYVIRYDGNLKPYFTDNTDILYYKDYVSDDRTEGLSNLQDSIYIKYAYTGFEPNYPSIGYSACKKLNKYDRRTLPLITVSEYSENIPLINTLEYSWFNNGVSIFIMPEHKFTYINKLSEDNKYKSINEMIYETLKDYYNVDDNLLKYIINLYNVKTDWEYLSDTNIIDYIYTIELKLK